MIQKFAKNKKSKLFATFCPQLYLRTCCCVKCFILVNLEVKITKKQYKFDCRDRGCPYFFC